MSNPIDTADVIIVGGGSAGAVLAAQLLTPRGKRRGGGGTSPGAAASPALCPQPTVFVHQLSRHCNEAPARQRRHPRAELSQPYPIRLVNWFMSK
jgi:glycine/D-amino acid oxidase-like deaminating enzyme